MLRIKQKNKTEIISRDLSGCSFSGINLVDRDFSHLILDSANFNNADRIRCNFMNCQLPNASFYNTDLDGCLFNNSNLKSADFRNPVKIRQCDFSGADLTGALLHPNYETKERFINGYSYNLGSDNIVDEKTIWIDGLPFLPL